MGSGGEGRGAWASMLMVLMVFLAVALVGCGPLGPGQSPYASAPGAIKDSGLLLLDPTPTPAGTSSGGDLRNTKLTVTGASITPSNIPDCKSSDVDEILFSANVSFAMELNQSFQYNRTNWGLRFRSPLSATGTDGRLYRVKAQEKNFFVPRDEISPDSESKTLTDKVSGIVEFRIALVEGEWALICALAGKQANDVRSSIVVDIVYSIRDTITPGDSDGTSIQEAIRMQNDVGLIRAAPTVELLGTSSGSVTLGISGPDNLEAELPSDGYRSIGPSQLSGYLVMYWQEGACDEATWGFQTNAQNRSDPSAPDPTLSCSYRGLDAMVAATGSCPLGCGSDPLPELYPRNGVSPSGDDVAVPLNSGTCYRTQIVKPGRKTKGITGLTNNQRYGFVVWPLDSSGTLGGARSRCIAAVPVKVPMAASSDTSASVRDCFVATAASGSPGSLTVHYWRIIRDRFLDPMGLSRLYYRHARPMAAWLERHPSWKRPVNAVLLAVGGTIVATDLRVTDGWRTFTQQAAAIWQRLTLSWHNLALQWGGVALASEKAAEDAKPSKALRLVEEIHAAGTPDKGTKALPETPPDPAGGGSSGEPAKPGDAPPPSKKLPPVAAPEALNVAPTKTLPPPSNEPLDHEAKEPRVYPEGSAAAATRLSGGLLQPSKGKLFDAYYPTGHPVRIALQQTFRLLDAMGEWGLGFTGSMQFHKGRVPKTLPDGTTVTDDVAGRRIGYYMTGVYLTTDYRWRYVPTPPVTVRLSASFGGERLRETADEVGAAESVGSDDSGSSGKFGYTLLKPMILAGGALELSFGSLLGKRFANAALGYGARDILLAADGLFSFDLSGHAFSQSGLLLGGSLVFLLE